MNILLTNDDGFDCPGVHAVAEALSKRYGGAHDVRIVTPDTNQSGASQRLGFLRGTLTMRKHGPGAFSCDGSPADCALAVIRGALPGFRPDLVLSGINKGENLGSDLLYSGTAAAARQAALMGVPAAALSLAGKEPFFWEMAADWAAARVGSFQEKWRDDIFFNINIPNREEGPAGEEVTWPARKNYHDTLRLVEEEGGEESLCVFTLGRPTTDGGEGSDIEAVSRNFVSVSPVFLHPVVRGDLCPQAPERASGGPGCREAKA